MNHIQGYDNNNYDVYNTTEFPRYTRGWQSSVLALRSLTRSHARTHARTNEQTHARTHTRSVTPTHARSGLETLHYRAREIFAIIITPGSVPDCTVTMAPYGHLVLSLLL